MVLLLRGWGGYFGTGNVPSRWICSNDLTMSGMLRASAQSQSRRPFLVGSLVMLVTSLRCDEGCKTMMVL